MMLAFVLLAGSLAAGAAVLLLLPLMRKREDASPASVTAVCVLLLLLLGGAGLYAVLTKYSWVEASVAETPAAMTAKLAKRLAEEPDNLDGWLMLGRSYFDLEQFPLSARAYQRADRLANGTNVEAITGYAESLIAQNFEEIRGRAGRMFERVLELQPDNPKALLYAALAAMGRGEPAVARDRFTRMLAQNPPANIRAIVEQQLRAIDAAAGQQGGQGGERDAADARVQVRVAVAPNLRYQLTAQSALFVLARDPDQPGPPFAAKRLPPQFPAEVSLSAADAMLPQRQIRPGQKLEVVARISLSGQPQSASGDPYGQVSYHVGTDGKLNLVIDKLAP
jgi:cytochrome c-type biogenesis protein CcmH